MLAILTQNGEKNNDGNSDGRKLWELMHRSMGLVVVMVYGCVLTSKLIEMPTLNIHSFSQAHNTLIK